MADDLGMTSGPVRGGVPPDRSPSGAQIVSLQRRLPVSTDERMPHAPDGPAAARVLVAVPDEEDFALIARLLGRAQEHHFLVEHAPSTGAALDHLAGSAFMVCLVDQQQGGSTGLDLAVTAWRQGIRTPFILLSDGELPWLGEAAIQAGLADCLEKEELDVQRLERAITLALARERRRNGPAGP